MKKQNVRNTVIGAVCGVAILAAVVLLVLWGVGWFERTPDPTPNADFGHVTSRYRVGDGIVIGDCAGDTDVVSIDYVLPNESDEVYFEFVARNDGYNTSYTHFRYPRRRWKTTSDGLMLHLLATVHADTQLVQTALPSLPSSFDERRLNPCHAGMIEKLDENGEWVLLDTLESEYIDNGIYAELHGMAIYNTGTNHLALEFPIHEPGTYRFTYNFRTFERKRAFINEYTIGDEVYTVSHTLTIPEPSGKKFDVVAVDLTDSEGMAQVAALIRSNDGTMPLQNLRRTRLERYENGEWVDVSDTLIELYDVDHNYNDYSDVVYEVIHPFAAENVENLFCGIAAFDSAVAGEYRLTLEFADGQMPDAARYALQLKIDIS